MKPPSLVSEQLHQDVQVLYHHVPPVESPGAVPATRQFLLPLPAGAAADPGDILPDADHNRYTTYRCIGADSC